MLTVIAADIALYGSAILAGIYIESTYVFLV
jgi:hypothetical protein